MPILSCPTCGKSLNIPADLVGKQVKCSACMAVFTAEEPGYKPAEESSETRRRRGPDPDSRVADEGEYEDDRPRRRRRRRPLDDDDYDHRDADRMPHRGVLVLTLGILSIPLSCCPLAGIVLGAVAMNMASNDSRGYATGRIDPAGESMSNAGRICGIIGLCLGLLHCVGWGVFRFGHFR